MNQILRNRRKLKRRKNWLLLRSPKTLGRKWQSVATMSLLARLRKSGLFLQDPDLASTSERSAEGPSAVQDLEPPPEVLLRSALSTADLIRLAIQQLNPDDPRVAEEEAELSKTD